MNLGLCVKAVAEKLTGTSLSETEARDWLRFNFVAMPEEIRSEIAESIMVMSAMTELPDDAILEKLKQFVDQKTTEYDEAMEKRSMTNEP